MPKYKVIISGGGTGGHIFPAIAIANALRKKHPETEILFVGALGRMEMEKVPKAGYEIIGLPIAGIQRRLTLKNFLVPFKLLKSLRKSKAIIKKFNPDIAIGVGGYASGPLLYQSAKMGIPTLVQEQNSYPGITNKLLAKKVKKICVAYDGMERFFPAKKIIITGNPVRQDIANLDSKKNEAIDFFQLDANKKTVLIIGGSLGARTINESIEKNLAFFIKNGFQVIWQTGKFYFNRAQESADKVNKAAIKTFAFIEKMDLAYAASDIVVSRAGAISVSEICLAKKAAILIPSPNVSEDHQTKNAMALVNKNAALLVKDVDAQNSLNTVFKELTSSPEKIDQLKENISKLARKDAANEIANEVIKLIDKN